MKRFLPSTTLALTVFLSAYPAHAAQPFEISTLLGTGNARMPFVQEVVRSHVRMVPGDNVADFTTGVLYFAWKNGARSVQTIQVLQDEGYATLDDAKTAIDLASSNSAIVISPLGGTDFEELCAKMAEKQNTAFLISLGGVGYTLSPFFTKCASRNILFVTVLNPELTGLGEFASYGPLVRLAVPGVELSAPVDQDRSASFLSDGFGMAVAAGKLTEFLRRNPSLQGAALLSGFLHEAEVLPSLRGKITGARAITKFAR